MKILMVAAGSRGDVQPYIALGKGLLAAGHSVQVVTSDDFENPVRESGLGFGSLGDSIEAMLQTPEWRSTLEQPNFIKVLGRMNQEMTRRATVLAQTLPALLADADLVVAGMSGHTGAFTIAAKMGIPFVQAYLFPITPTSAYSSPLTPNLPFGRQLNRLSFFGMQQALWQSSQAGDVATRKVLGLPAEPLLGPFAALAKNRQLILYGFSQHVLPYPSDWGDYIQTTGYWFDALPSDWTPPIDLVEFLEAGSPPVYIGFGSMGSRNPAATGQLALEALALSGQRGVIAAGWGGLSAADLPETVHMLTAIPHSWLFPQMAAVVHHGGAGTTAAGLRAGVPSIVVPFMGDQPFWGQRVAQLGVGPAPIPRKQLTAERLAAAIHRAMTDPSLRQKAAELGLKISAEDGVEKAVAAIERWGQASGTPSTRAR